MLHRIAHTLSNDSLQRPIDPRSEAGLWDIDVDGEIRMPLRPERNEFVNRYRGYRMRNLAPDYPPRLIGIANASNSERHLAVSDPVLIGNGEVVALVMAGGVSTPLLQITSAKAAAPAVPALESN